MWQRAQNSGSGGGTIPFKVTVYQSRVTITKQNCYLWSDNGTPKLHVELSFTANTSISANSAILNNFLPFNTSTIETKSVLPDNLYIRPTTSAPMYLYLASTSAISANTTRTINQDITCSYGN